MPTPKRLLAGLSSACLGSVRLCFGGQVQYEQWPLPPALPPMVVTALVARSASTLTALHELPLVEPWVEPPPKEPGLGLAALTQLRALTLRQTWGELEELRATDLPSSLEDLTMVMEHPDWVQAVWEDLPVFVAFDRLQHLRRITLAHYWSWARWNRPESWRHLAVLPPSLEACFSVALWAALRHSA